MENNLEVAGVEEAEKVLFTTHYLSGAARAWWDSVRAMQGGQALTWEEFKLKFSRAHVPMGLIKRMRDEFRRLKQAGMSVEDYRNKFLTLSRYAPDETDTEEKKKERFLNGLHDEMQCVLVNIAFPDLEALVDSAIQMEGKLNQSNENRKRRMMHQGGPSNHQKSRPNGPSGYAPRPKTTGLRHPVPTTRTVMVETRTQGREDNNFNRAPPPRPNGNNYNNTAPRTGSNAVPLNDKSGITCFECGVTGHYSNECPKKLNAAPKPNAPAQQQRRVGTGKNYGTGNPYNRHGRMNHISAEEAREAPDVVLGMFPVNSISARVLFDSGASHSFVTENFACKSKIELKPMKHAMLVQIPGSTTKARWICKSVPIIIQGVEFRANLIVLGTQGLEVVLGMDWLAQHQGLIDCANQAITVTSSTGVVIRHVAEKLPRTQPMQQEGSWTNH